ncbi:FMN-binding negative transcriptional regulator [Pararhodobacter sp.]|uniref:FMN-binding negative transcriptional regulator n=1 Tax=Pararhodobacter sp. TaxID=2127056 RepID=UPI002AFEB971|nr:FMN-binding negative transcriptional regulator [Pararhodobacter sp.]
MYTPSHFAEADRAEIENLLLAHPLAALVAHTDAGLVVNHIPVLRDGAEFIGHIALANDLHRAYVANTPVVAIFTASDGYVSPNWYPSKAATHEAVPTWNYQAIHVHGVLEFTHDDAQKRRILNQLTRHFEVRSNGDRAWRMGDAPAAFLQDRLDAIVAFRLIVTRLDAKSKLSQNRARADSEAVAEEFARHGNAAMSAAMRRAWRE